MSDFFNEHVMRYHWENLKRRHDEWVARRKLEGE